MLYIYQIFAFASFLIFIATLLTMGYASRLRPSSLFLLFFVFQYGPTFLVDVRHPHNLDFINSFHVADFGPVIAEYAYAAFSLAYLGLSAGLFLTRAMLDTRSERAHVRLRSVLDQDAAITKVIYIALLTVAAICTALFLSLEIIRQKIEFFASLLSGHADALDYKTFRRITLGDDPIYREMGRLRMDLSLPLMAIIAAWGAFVGRPRIERFSVFLAFSVVTIFDLTKQGTLIAFLVFVTATYLARNHGIIPSPRKLIVPGIVISAVGVVLLFGLYLLQYSGSQTGMDASALWEVLFYRVFAMNADALNLYFVFFRHPLFYQGITTSPVLAAIFHMRTFDETQYIPQIYAAVTSFPTVYFGGMWVDFGWLGIAFASIAVGAICSVADYLVGYIRCVPLRAAYIACAMFSLNYFSQVQFLTCLSSYGVAPILVGFPLLDYLLIRFAASGTQYTGSATRGT